MSKQSAPCIVNPILIFEGVLTFMVTLAWNQTFAALAKTILPNAPELAVNLLHAVMVTIFVLVVILSMRALTPFGERYEANLDILRMSTPVVNDRERCPSPRSTGGRQSRDYVMSVTRDIPVEYR